VVVVVVLSADNSEGRVFDRLQVFSHEQVRYNVTHDARVLGAYGAAAAPFLHRYSNSTSISTCQAPPRPLSLRRARITSSPLGVCSPRAAADHSSSRAPPSPSLRTLRAPGASQQRCMHLHA
jgi:hypothetical protein